MNCEKWKVENSKTENVKVGLKMKHGSETRKLLLKVVFEIDNRRQNWKIIAESGF